ncbi:MAG: NrfD/PsrC family molybdoenzyme membrane anchor subunit, partial [bacterium]
MDEPEAKSTTLISPISRLGYPTELLAPRQTYASVNKTIADIPLKRAPGPWWVGFIISFLLLMMFLVAVTWLFWKGVGIWGINIPVAWGFAIVNFVWWVGIAHAGTFISAILL